jgi:hypothetical protein
MHPSQKAVIFPTEKVNKPHIDFELAEVKGDERPFIIQKFFIGPDSK